MIAPGVAGVPGFTTMVTPVVVAVVGLAHAAFDVRTTLTTSLLVIVVLLNVALLVPTGLPFINHWYLGVVPPLTGVAVKLTELPGQILLVEAEIETEGTGAGKTVIVSLLLVAVGVVGQMAEDVITTITTSPLFKLELEKLVPPEPTGFPFSNH